jgi:hypothetical protein
MTDTLATAASAPTSADPGELGPSIAPAAPSAAPKPTEHAQTYEQRREAQDAANAAAKPEAAAKPADEAHVDPQAPQAPGEKVKVGKYEVSEAELASMMDRQAQEDLKKLTLPSAPEAYKAELPADLKLPGGVEYKFDQSNPSLAAARNMAHSMGLSQDQFSQILGVYASHEAQQNAVLAERSRLEIAKAGVNAPQRVDAVSRFITGLMGEADAKQIKALVVTDSMLRYHETIMAKLSSQGAASFSQSHRVAPETGGIPGYDKMSFEQRRLAQDQAAARRR